MVMIVIIITIIDGVAATIIILTVTHFVKNMCSPEMFSRTAQTSYLLVKTEDKTPTCSVKNVCRSASAKMWKIRGVDVVRMTADFSITITSSARSPQATTAKWIWWT